MLRSLDSVGMQNGAGDDKAREPWWRSERVVFLLILLFGFAFVNSDRVRVCGTAAAPPLLHRSPAAAPRSRRHQFGR